jgi:hypothetical protein
MSEVVDGLITALNAHDFEAAAALMHEDYHSEQPAHLAEPLLAVRRCTLIGKPFWRASLISTLN